MNVQSFAIGMVGVGLLAGAASAALTPLDSSSFSRKYEMDGSTAIPDDVASDWTLDFGGIHSASQSGGHLDYLSGAGADIYWDSSKFTTDTTYAGGATVEFKVRVDSSSADQAFQIVVPAGNGEYTTVTVGLGNAYISTYMVDTSDNTDDYHTFRIVREGNSSLINLYRDGVAVANGYGSNGNNAAVPLRFGDGTSAFNGSGSVDYIRWTVGAYSPVAVPEPASLGLLALGGLALVRRRRGA